MSSSSIQQKAIEVLILINAAITNLRLHSPSIAMIVHTIEAIPILTKIGKPKFFPGHLIPTK